MKRISITFKNISNNITKYKFGIKTVAKAGETSYWPMVKAPGLFSQWRPLVKVENEIQIMDYETPYGLSMDECYSRIEAFKDQLANQALEKNIQVSIAEVTDQEIATRHDVYANQW